jgi:hypothetical protein
MRNPRIYQRLAEELERAFPDTNAEQPFTELEGLPYLASLSPVIPFPSTLIISLTSFSIL